MSEDRTLARRVGWRRIGDPSTERAELWRDDEGWTLEGTVEAVVEQPFRVTYVVGCSPSWATRSVMVRQVDREGERALEMAVGPDGRWDLDGEPMPDLDRCVDVDLGVTPSTNTLPIRRLDLDVGAGAEIVAAWVRFPSLDVIAAPQRYTRLAEDRYLYQSNNFRAELEVDDLGLVVTYAGVWERDGSTG